MIFLKPYYSSNFYLWALASMGDSCLKAVLMMFPNGDVKFHHVLFICWLPSISDFSFIDIGVDAWILTFFSILISNCPRFGQWESVQAGFYVLLTRPRHSLPQTHFLAQNGPPLYLLCLIPGHGHFSKCLFLYNLAKSDFLYCLIFSHLIGEK